MADAYSALQKSLRCGNEESSLYWAGQIGKSVDGHKGYPNALKKRLCQNSLEDAASWSYSSRILKETATGPKLTFEELLPWVVALCRLSKTHSSAWINRVAVDKIYRGEWPSADADSGAGAGADADAGSGAGKRCMHPIVEVTVENSSEVDFACACLVAHRDANLEKLRRLSGREHETALKMYRFVNNDPLVLHSLQMEMRRPELRGRRIILPVLSTSRVAAILNDRRDIPCEWRDKHTKAGKAMGRGYGHFFETMVLRPRVYPRGEGEAEASARGGGEPYEADAKALYLDFRLNGLEARVRHVLALAVMTSPDTGAGTSTSAATTMGGRSRVHNETSGSISGTKRSLAVAQASDTPAAVPTPVVESSTVWGDTELFALPPEGKLLGFKNVTCVGVLNITVPELRTASGAKIFVKIGEDDANCQFAYHCDQLRGSLKMTSSEGNCAVLMVKLTRDYEALANATNTAWGRGVASRLAKARSVRGVGADAPLPALVSSVFDGVNACDCVRVGVDMSGVWLGNGVEFLKVLLFRKFVGCGDTNGRNIMVSPNGGVLSCDETRADHGQISKGLTKGLITAQAISVELRERAVNALTKHPAEIAKFIARLRALKLPGLFTEGGRLTAVHAAGPFDDVTFQRLCECGRNAKQGLSGSSAAADTRYLMNLASRLHLK